MATILPALLILTALLFTAAILNRPANRKHQPLPTKHTPAYRFNARTNLCTTNELAFFHVLRRTFPNHAIMVQVPLITLLEPLNQSSFNHIAQKSVDFVLCHPDTLQPLAAIELDDSTHAAPKRQQRDHDVNAAFAQTSIPLHRIPAKPSYSRDDLHSLTQPPNQ